MSRKVMGTGPIPAKIMIIGEAPGQTEELQGIPFIGQSGEELTRMLAEAGIKREDCYVTNAIKFRPPNNEIRHFFYSNAEAKDLKLKPYRGLYPKPIVFEGLSELDQEIKRVKPNIIIALGNYAFWAVSENCDISNKEKAKIPTGIGKWRGSVIPPDETYCKIKLLPAYHPAAILRVWEWRAITVHDLKRAAKEIDSPDYTTPNYDFIVRPDFATVATLLQKLYARAEQMVGRKLVLAADIETRKGHIACLGIAWSRLNALCIPFMTTKRFSGYWSQEEEARIIWLLYKLFTHSNVHVVGQNFAYDMQYIARRWGFIFPLSDDTLFNQHALLPGTPKALDYLASLYCAFYCYWKDEGKEWDPSMDEERLWIYNCKDAVNTFEVNEEQQKILDAWGLRPVQQFLLSLFGPVVGMMLRGVAIDLKLRQQFAMQLLEQITEHEHWFNNVMKGINIAKPKAAPWYASTKQLQFLFYELLKQPKIQSRKTGRDSADDESLSIIYKREPLLRPLIDKIKEFRSLRIFYTNFVLASLDHDNRMRCSYNIAGTETLRLSSSEDAFGFGTNLQNLPKGNEE